MYSMYSRSFWFGAGSIFLIWLFRRQLRPLAVKGAKGLILVGEGIKKTFQESSDAINEIVSDAQENNLRTKMEALDLDDRQLSMLKREVGKLTQQMSMLNKVLAEGAKEKREDESL